MDILDTEVITPNNLMGKSSSTDNGFVVLNPLTLVFKKSVTFEGKEYTSVDFSKLEDWTCDDVVNVTKKFNKMTEENTSAMGALLPESNLEYCQFVAAEASGLPIDFFKRLPAREAGPLRSLIISFFHSTD